VDSDFNLNGHEADVIKRLSALETLREQAREGNRMAMLSSVEKLIEAELRSLHKIRREKTGHAEPHGR
jgi:hypothetical protein